MINTPDNPNINASVRPSKTRGFAKRDWLESYHSFSFADYVDHDYMHFSVLRVLNEDVVAPSMGFGMHPHHDMEIITYMVAGELRHADSLGNGSVIRAGDVQRMTAGSGIVHSEVNASATESAHFLQIWILPNALNLTPRYQEQSFDTQSKFNQWRLIASNTGREGSLIVHQDLQLFASVISQAFSLEFALARERSAYLQVITGQVDVNGFILNAGDALMVNPANDIQTITVNANLDAEILLFDLPKE